MGWFEEQIQNRINEDQNDLNDVIIEMAGIITNSRILSRFNNDRISVNNAMAQILKYYDAQIVEASDDKKQDIRELLEYHCRMAHIMYRNVVLEPGWSKKAFGAMLGTLKDSGKIISIFPDVLGRYYYLDSVTNQRIRISRKNEGQIDCNAICFYKGLPRDKVTPPDVISFMLLHFRAWDWLSIMLYTAFSVAAGLLIAPLTELVYNEVLSSGKLAALTSILFFLLTVKLSQSIMDMLVQLGIDRSASKLEITLQSAVMMRLLTLPSSFFREHISGELASRIDLIPDFCTKVVSAVRTAVYTLTFSMVYLVQLGFYAKKMAGSVCLQVLLVIAVDLYTIIALGRNRREFLECKATEQGYIYSSILGIGKIRSTGSENRTFINWAKLYTKANRLMFHPQLWLRIWNAVPTALSLLTTGLLYSGAVSVSMSADEYLGFLACYGVLTGVLTQLTVSVENFSLILPIYNMIRPILETEQENPQKRTITPKLRGNISVSDLTFSYTKSGRNILEHLNLTIHAGEYVALVGSTGCGKSTLTRLLLGFEQPDGGNVYYDNRPLRNMDLHFVRRQIGTVLQDGKLIIGNIFSNIVLSNPELALDDAWRAAEMAGIADDIRQMPMGMHTLISEENGSISGGQRQRLMIARAIAGQPKILIFDEATSALDNISQKNVSESLDSLHCTRIVIAHRLSTIRNCDRILVMDKGSIISEGKYDELLEKCPLFVELVKRQTLDLE